MVLAVCTRRGAVRGRKFKPALRAAPRKATLVSIATSEILSYTFSLDAGFIPLYSLQSQGGSLVSAIVCPSWPGSWIRPFKISASCQWLPWGRKLGYTPKRKPASSLSTIFKITSSFWILIVIQSVLSFITEQDNCRVSNNKSRGEKKILQGEKRPWKGEKDGRRWRTSGRHFNCNCLVSSLCDPSRSCSFYEFSRWRRNNQFSGKIR